jgi:hypothetical protein
VVDAGAGPVATAALRLHRRVSENSGLDLLQQG